MFLPAALGTIAGAILSVALPHMLGTARQWVPRWFGFLKVAHVRTAAGAVFGLAAAAGISLSISDHSHKKVTYLVWYGLAALAFIVVIATTIVIERRLARDTKQSSSQEPNATMNALLRRRFYEHRGRRSVPEEAPRGRQPLSPAERRRIASETESRRASSIHDDTLRLLDRGKEPGSQPNLSPPALADELSLYKEKGISIRRDIDPPTGYAASSISVLNQMMPALGERSVRSWSMSVRAHLERHAPRFLVIFDEGPDLPPPHVFAAAVPTTNRPELLAFLDHKLRALDRIIRTIVEDPEIR